MQPVVPPFSPALLRVYDDFLFLRENLLHNALAQILCALFFVASLIISVVLFVYWSYCARCLFLASGESLTDAEMDALRWDRPIRQTIWALFFPHRFMLQ